MATMSQKPSTGESLATAFCSAMGSISPRLIGRLLFISGQRPCWTTGCIVSDFCVPTFMRRCSHFMAPRAAMPRILRSLRARVEGVAQAVAEKVEAGDGEGDQDAREEGDPGRLAKKLCALLSMMPQLASGG